MKRRFAILAALLVLAGLNPVEAQRPPLLGIWYGPIQCGPTGGRFAKLFMYGNGTGLLELGVSPATPNLGPSVAMVSLRQQPEADYVLIDQWVSNGVEPRPQFGGRLGQDGTFSGQVLNDATCTVFSFAPQRFSRFVLRDMARMPIRTAQREATMLDPHLTFNDVAGMAALGGALWYGVPGMGQSGGGGGGIAPSGSAQDGRAAAPPSIGGNVQGNRDTNIHGNELQDGHGNTLRPLPF